MAKERLYLFDTTMRDGALTTGVDFSLDDKRHIAAMLDRLGIDYVEGGYPGANPLDTEFFKQKPTKNARFCAFGMTKRPGRSAANDPGLAGLLAADADAIVYVAKPLFERQGFTAQKRNIVRKGDQWLANTTMTKTFGAESAPPTRH